jgi:hypothetical protein
LATDGLFVDVFDIENSPLAKSQFISNFFGCSGELMDHHTMQADEDLLMFLDVQTTTTDAAQVMSVRNQDYFLLAGSRIALSHATTHLSMIHSWMTQKAETKKPRIYLLRTF